MKWILERKALSDRGSALSGEAMRLNDCSVPGQSQILEATPEKPLLSVLLRFDMPTVREVLSSDDIPDAEVDSGGHGITVGKTTLGLLDAYSRLLDLLDTPEDIAFLSRHIQSEIIYRILSTPQAGRLRGIATKGELSHKTAHAIAWLRANYMKPLHMEELAATARMGVSTLHHQFRSLTAMSPLQYQKHIRLQTARQRMLMDGLDASRAAYEVGYDSVSQFNREYSRLFGLPPIRDVRALRESLEQSTARD